MFRLDSYWFNFVIIALKVEEILFSALEKWIQN